MGKIIIKLGDITQENVDVVVNAANTRLAGGGGVDGAIHRAAGVSVMEECRKIGGCPTGEAMITGAGSLKARKIIHTPGPVWHGGRRGEAEALRNCYRNSLRLAEESGAATIAFPAISTGMYGYPVKEAAEIAISEGLKNKDNFDEIVFVCFSEYDYNVYEEVYKRMNG
ncbi:MAG: O-acetyl-ADP-ribose deacetylase [Candidatus Omnitrophota bacterium]